MDKDCSEGVKKGSWSEEEDTLLRNCIEKFGEGKWYLVPARAGLNRCRKSCRLRWLNYLRPNIKKGCFSRDEVDLIKRLHKLLGNRWSLIAGRLPGRTANDVKNFWNTHISKTSFVGCNQRVTEIVTKTNIVRPRPRTFPKLQTNVCRSVEERSDKPQREEGGSKDKNIKSLSGVVSNQSDYQGVVPPFLPQEVDDDDDDDDDELMRWWSSLLEIDEIGELGNEFFPGFDNGVEEPSPSMILEGDPKNHQSELADDLQLDDDLDLIWG